jgi:uncharacterized protein with GYD domain
MSVYMLLCNFTDQGVRNIKDAQSRRAAAREMRKKLGVDIKAGYLAMGTYDLLIHAEAASDEAMATFTRKPPTARNLRRSSYWLRQDGGVHAEP